MKPIIVLGQRGGRRYVVSTPPTEKEAFDLTRSLNLVEISRKNRTTGQSMTRYAVYKLAEEK